MNELYQQWLQIPADRLPPNHYALLGLDDFESDTTKIDEAAKQRAAYLHSIAAGPQRKAVQELLGMVASARRVLTDPESKTHYDDQLRNPAPAARPTVVPTSNAAAPTAAANASAAGTPASSRADSYAASRRKRKQFQWKFHAISASVLLLIVLIVYFVNRGGGGRRAADAKPLSSKSTATQSTGSPAPKNQKPSGLTSNKTTPDNTTPNDSESSSNEAMSSTRTKRTANASVSSSQARPVAPKSQKLGAEIGRTKGSGLLSGGKFDEVLADVNVPGASVPGAKDMQPPAKSGDGPSDATPISLAKDWLAGLKAVPEFPGDVAKRFKIANTQRLFNAADGAMIVQPAENAAATQTLSETKPSLESGQAVSLTVQMSGQVSDGQLVAIGFPKWLIGIRTQGDRMEIVSSQSGSGDDFQVIESMPKTDQPIRLAVVRDSKPPSRFRWIVDGPDSAHSGQVDREKMGTKAGLVIHFRSTKETPADAIKLTDLKTGKLKKAPDWP
ncbi:hypothetical protein [Stieleria varia]|uniref:J domain-containing protein n=1 Tax=Stieleria varia TaxID=2528005 RepID=A0A5C6A198_9BACT|nr:hypothetical protein [Stieleria varia]TWT93196.1 hypothetical protein Pla52n_58530 [Stieleria varia]